MPSLQFLFDISQYHEYCKILPRLVGTAHYQPEDSRYTLIPRSQCGLYHLQSLILILSISFLVSLIVGIQGERENLSHFPVNPFGCQL